MSAAPSTMPEELPAWWTWSIAGTQWYFSSATSSKPASAPIWAKLGLRPARPSGLVSGRISSSWSSTVTPLRSLTGTTDVGEVAVGPRLGGPVVRLRGVRVDVGAGPALEGGDQVGADALRDEAGRERGGRVHRPRAAVGAHRHPAHRLDAAGEDQVLEAGADPHRGLVDGLEAGGAEAVELDAGRRSRGSRRRGPRSWRCRRPARRSGSPRRARRRRPGAGRARGCGSWISSSRPTTRSTGFTSCSEPTALPLPRGVRMWSYTNASAMTVLLSSIGASSLASPRL